MKLLDKLASVHGVLKAKLFNQRTPLLVNWEITRRCNAKCRYCNIWDNPSKELDTGQVLAIIRELSLLGTRMIHFTGGEPLLREDIGVILDYCHQKHIPTAMNSNGYFIPERINEIATLQLLGISIDGPEDVHDSIRGKGSYARTIEAITVARKKGIKIRLLVVLSECNLDAVDFLLEKAAEFDAPIIFQPATRLLLGSQEKNPIAPNLEKYKRVIRELIVRKRSTRYIANSISGLKFLQDWPEMKKIKCLAQLVSCRIQSDGCIYICYRNQDRAVRMEHKTQPFKDAFSKLPFVYCDCCCCASAVELNCLLSLRPDTMLNSWNFI